MIVYARSKKRKKIEYIFKEKMGLRREMTVKTRKGREINE